MWMLDMGLTACLVIHSVSDRRHFLNLDFSPVDRCAFPMQGDREAAPVKHVGINWTENV